MFEVNRNDVVVILCISFISHSVQKNGIYSHWSGAVVVVEAAVAAK